MIKRKILIGGFMKKLLIFFLCISKVNALTYYTDYGDVKVSEEYIESSDLREVRVIDNSKYFLIEKEYGQYYIEGENDFEYPMIDRNNSMTEISYSNVLPDNKLNRTYINDKYYNYYLMWPVRYVKLKTNNNITIKDIKVKEYDNPLNITLIKNGNNLYTYNEITINNNDELVIDMGSLYNVEIIKIEITYVNNANLVMSIYDELDDSPFLEKYIDNSLGFNIYRFEDFELVSPKYSPSIYSKEYPSVTISTKVETINNYKIVDTKYLYYKEKKTYVDYVTENKEEDIKYEYRERDYIDIDKIVIEEYGINITDFIKSNKEYEIKTNVNYLVNGEYDVFIKFQNLEIQDKVIVNIKENEELNYKLNEYNLKLTDYEKTINNLNYKLSKKDYEIKEIINNSNKKIELLNNKVTSPSSLEVENDNKVNIKIIIVFVIIIFILIVERIFREINS